MQLTLLENKLTFQIVFLLMLIVCIPISSQDRDKSKVNIHIDGSSRGVIEKKDNTTDIYFHFWIDGELEYNKELSYTSRFVYKVKSLTAGYSFKKFVLVKDPPEECTHDTATVYENRNLEVDIPGSITGAELVIDYGAGITKNAIESIKDYLPQGVEIPDVDVVPTGFYELNLESVLEEIVGRRYAVVKKQCIDLPSTVNLNIGDVKISCQIKDDGSLSGNKKWERSYTGGTESRFKVEGCEEEEKGKKVKDPIKYQLKWSFTTDDDCKYKIMKALAHAKDTYEEGIYTRLFDLVDRLLEENESAYKIDFTTYSKCKTIKEAQRYLNHQEKENYDELRRDLHRICRDSEGEELVRLLKDHIDQKINWFYHQIMHYEGMAGRLTEGQIYIKEQMVKLSRNDKHYLSLYVDE